MGIFTEEMTMSEGNKKRAADAEATIAEYAKIKKDMEWEDDMTRLTDLLADMMHFCHRNADREDCPMDFDRALNMARIHFESEK
jgi:UDP-glucose 4-epimerase